MGKEGFHAQEGAIGAQKYPDGELKLPFEEFEGVFVG